MTLEQLEVIAKDPDISAAAILQYARTFPPERVAKAIVLLREALPLIESLNGILSMRRLKPDDQINKWLADLAAFEKE